MAPPASPGAKSSPGVLLKKIPPWGWAIGAGGVLGLGYTLYKSRRADVPLSGPAGEESLATGDFATYDLATQPSPGGAYYPSTPIIAEPAETVGAVGQTALETAIGGMTGIVESLPALFAAVPQPQTPEPFDPTGIIESFFGNLPQTPAPAPAPIPAPKKPPATAPPKGVTILGKTFPQATGYTEVKNPGIGRTFNLKFHGRTEQWETWDTEVYEVKVKDKDGKGTHKEKRQRKISRKWKKVWSHNS